MMNYDWDELWDNPGDDENDEEGNEEYERIYTDLLSDHDKIVCPYCNRPLIPCNYDSDLDWEGLLRCKEHGNFQFHQIARCVAGLDWEQSPYDQYDDDFEYPEGYKPGD